MRLTHSSSGSWSWGLAACVMPKSQFSKPRTWFSSQLSRTSVGSITPLFWCRCFPHSRILSSWSESTTVLFSRQGPGSKQSKRWSLIDWRFRTKSKRPGKSYSTWGYAHKPKFKDKALKQSGRSCVTRANTWKRQPRSTKCSRSTLERSYSRVGSKPRNTSRVKT